MGLKKHSVSIAGHRTSISLEPEFWDELNAIASRREKSLAALIAEIDAARVAHNKVNLSSALRLYVLKQAKET